MSPVIHIGEWQAFPELDRLRGGDGDVALAPKEMDLLTYFADHSGEVVSVDQIIENVWQGAHLGDDTVYVTISHLRRALGDNAKIPTYIETIPKRGYRLIADVRIKTGARGSRKKPLALAGLFVLALLVAIYQFLDLNKPPSVSGTSIAVLPFADLSPEGDQAYFADGIAEELLNALAKVPGLQVTSRSSAFSFKGKDLDIPTVAEQLGVSHVVEGSVRRGGDTVRITAQLIDVSTDKYLWSESYDRELTDIFAIQDEISAAIVAALSETLGLTLPSAPKLQRTLISAAYNEYLLGILEMSRRGGASLVAAKEHLERALELDPDYAPAHARLSITLGLLQLNSNRHTFMGVKEAWAYHAESAMALAPDAPESLAAKGFYAWFNPDSDWEVGAIFERAIALNPSYTDVLIWLAVFSRDLGDYRAEIDLTAQALRVDPLNPRVISNNAAQMINLGRFDEARPLIERLRTLSPSLYWGRRVQLAWRQDLIADAAIYVLERLAVDPTNVASLNALAELLAFDLGLADETTGLDHRNWDVLVSNGQIEKALAQAENGVPGLKGDVLLVAGRPGEAIGYLDQSWAKALATTTVDRFRPSHVVSIGRARQITGDQVGGREALEATLAVIARRRAAGYNLAELDWSEGVARYFLGQKEAGLRLATRAVERRYAGYILQPQFEPMTSDPGFAPILAAREAYAPAQREKFLRVVCNGGNPAPQVWTPKPETCEGHVEG